MGVGGGIPDGAYPIERMHVRIDAVFAGCVWLTGCGFTLGVERGVRVLERGIVLLSMRFGRKLAARFFIRGLRVRERGAEACRWRMMASRNLRYLSVVYLAWSQGRGLGYLILSIVIYWDI